MGNKIVMEAELLLDTSKAEAQGKRASRAIKAAYKAENTGARTQGQASSDSGMSRGLGGQTGAEGRDFAKQAQGLGGLVHVYATFAANIFALSAAFGALSKAADTTNMVKGLDQLGAQSGIALGSLSKQLVKATDGAVSLRDAMSSVAMSSSAGMTSDAILRMGSVAKQASQALGVSMSDAMSRLSRGVTKLEPELLDELGIFTRVDKASQEYARSIGKTSLSLTDFEKRQAFANAVLSEGEKKFGALNLDANPYSKLSASLANVAQTGLEVINKVIAPIASYMASSPTGLAVAISAITGVLLKQAIPALGMIRENAKRLEEDNRKRLVNQLNDQQEAAVSLDVIAAKKAEKEFLKEKEQVDKLAKLRSQRFSTDILGSDVRNSLRKSPFDLSTKEIADIEAKHKELADKVNSGWASKSEQAALQGLIKRKKGIQELADKMDEVGNAAAVANEQRDAKWYTTYYQKQKYLEKLQTIEKRSSIVSNAADMTANYGPIAAWKQMSEEISKSGDSIYGKFSTKVKSAFTIVGSAASTFLNAFSMWGQILAAIGVAYSIFDGYMSKGAKDAEAFALSTDQVTDAAKNLEDTLYVIKSKDASEILSITSLVAQANALDTINSSLDTTLKSFDKMLQTRSGWEKGKDFFADMFGSGAGDKLSNSIALSIKDTAKTLSGPELLAYRKEIQSIFGVKDIDLDSIDSIKKSYKDLSETVIQSYGVSISKINKDTVRGNIEVTRSLQSLKENISGLTKDIDTYTNSLIPTDAFSKFGTGLMKIAQDSSVAFKTTQTALLDIKEISSNIKVLSLIDTQTAQNLISASQDIGKVNADISTLELAISSSNKEASLLANELFKVGQTNPNSKEYDDLEKSLSNNVNAAYYMKQRLAEAKEKAEGIVTKFSELPNILARASLKNLEQGLNSALDKAAINFGKGIAGIIGQAGGFTGVLDAKLNISDLDLQRKDIEAKYANTLSIKQLTLTLERNNIINEKKLIRENLNMSEEAILSSRMTNNEDIKKYRELHSSENAIKTSMNAVASGNFKGITSGVKQGDSESLKAFQQVGDVITQLYGKQAQLANIVGQTELELLKKRIASEAKITLDTKERFTVRNKDIDNETERLKLLQATDILYNAETDNAIKQLGIEKDSNAYFISALDTAQSIYNLTVAIDALEEKNKNGTLGTGGQAALDAAKTAKLDKIKSLSDSANTFAEVTANKLLANTIDSVNKSREVSNKLQERTEVLSNLDKESYKLKISYQSSILDLRKEEGSITEKEYIQSKYNLESAQAQLSFDEKSLAIIKSNREEFNKLADAQTILNADTTLSAEQRLAKEINISNEKARLVDLQNKELNVAKQQLQQDQDLLDIRKKIAEEADWKKFKEGLADALASAIEDGFKNGETFAEGFAKFVQNSLSNLVIKPIIKSGSDALLDTVGLGTGKGMEGLTKTFDNVTKALKTDFGANIETSLQDGINSVSNNISRDFGGKLEVGVDSLKQGFDKFGGSVNEFFGGAKIFQKGANGASQALSYLSAADDILSGKRVGEGIGKALGAYFGGGNPIVSALGGELGKLVDSLFGSSRRVTSYTGVGASFSSKGNVIGSNRQFDYTPEADAQTLKTLQNVDAKYIQLADSLGVTTKQLNMSLGINDAGIYRVQGQTDNSNYDTGEQAYTKEGVQGGFTRVILSALQGSELPKSLKGVFDGINLGSMVQADLDSLIAKMQQFKFAAEQLDKVGIPVFKDLSYEALTSLADLSGGIDKFTSTVGSYINNFYKEEDKLAMSRASIAKVLVQAGALNKEADLPKTREGFKALVDSIQGTGPEAIRSANALMSVQEAFAQITPVTETLVKHLTDFEMTQAKLDQNIAIYTAIGDAETALKLTREKELSTLEDALKPGQLYLYALEDKAKAESKIKTIYDKATTSVKNYASQIKSLQSAMDAMLLGANSPLTPAQKYAEAKAQVDAVTKAINDNKGNDQASIDARNEALGRLPSATNAFLDSSKVLFASSENYNTDFNSMYKLLKDNKLELESQQTDAQRAVTELETSNGYLFKIQDSLKDLPQALRDLATANNNVSTTQKAASDAGVTAAGAAHFSNDTLFTKFGAFSKQTAVTDIKGLLANGKNKELYDKLIMFGVSSSVADQLLDLPAGTALDWATKQGFPAFAKGGVAYGPSIVGENGPEIVDFRQPGRVYSNTASNDLFANGNRELVAEIKALRAEVAQLRQDQKEQTGHIIATNYDANSKVASAVAESVDASSVNAAWAQRSQVKIA